MHVIHHSPYGIQILRVHPDRRTTLIAVVSDEACALRIAAYLDHEARHLELLDRHGTVDVPLTDVSPTG